jgi:hypothetical protein
MPQKIIHIKEMPIASLDEYNRLPRLAPSAIVELVGIHLHQSLPKTPLSIETVDGEFRINPNIVPLALKAHAKLLDGARAPLKGALKSVLEGLAEVSDGECDDDAAEALCNQLADEALERLQDRLTSAIRARLAQEKERLLSAALSAVAA